MVAGQRDTGSPSDPTQQQAAGSAQSQDAAEAVTPRRPPSPCVSLGVPLSPEFPPLLDSDAEVGDDLQVEPMEEDGAGEYNAQVVAFPAPYPKGYAPSPHPVAPPPFLPVENHATEPSGSLSANSVSEPNGSAINPITASGSVSDNAFGEWEFLPETLSVLHRPGVCPDNCDAYRGHLRDVHASRPHPQDYAAALNARGQHIVAELHPDAERLASDRTAAREIALRSEFEATLRDALARQAVELQQERDRANARAMEAERKLQDARDEATRDVARWASRAADTTTNNKKLHEELESSERKVREFRRNLDEAHGQIRDTRKELEDTIASNSSLDNEVNDRLVEIAGLMDDQRRLRDDLEYWKRHSNPYERDVDSDEEDAISDTSSDAERKSRNAQVTKSFRDAARRQKEQAKASSNSFGTLDLTSRDPSSSTKTKSRKNKGDKRKRPESMERNLGPDSNFDVCAVVTEREAWIMMDAYRRFQNNSARVRLNSVLFTFQDTLDMSTTTPANRFIMEHWPRLRDEGFMPVRPSSSSSTPARQPPEKRARTADESSSQAGPSQPLLPPPSHPPPQAGPSRPRYSGGWGDTRPLTLPRTLPSNRFFGERGQNARPLGQSEEHPMGRWMLPQQFENPRGARGGYAPSSGRGGYRGRTYNGYAVGPSFYNETFGPSGAWEDLPSSNEEYRQNMPLQGQIEDRRERRRPRRVISAPNTYDNPDEWEQFYNASGQPIPLGISLDSNGRPLRHHMLMHLMIHHIGPDREEYPPGRVGRDMWRPELGRFTQEAVGILSIPGLLELTWAEFQMSEFLYEGTRRPHFPPNIPINRETVARQLRRVVRGPSEIADLEAWARRRRNLMIGRNEDDRTPWPAHSEPTLYNNDLLSRVRASLNRGQPSQSAQSTEPSSSSAPTPGPSTQRRSPTPHPDNDDNMQH